MFLFFIIYKAISSPWNFGFLTCHKTKIFFYTDEGLQWIKRHFYQSRGSNESTLTHIQQLRKSNISNSVIQKKTFFLMRCSKTMHMVMENKEFLYVAFQLHAVISRVINAMLISAAKYLWKNNQNLSLSINLIKKVYQTLIDIHVSFVHHLISQVQIRSTPPPTHAEWTAAITGWGHRSITWKDSCSSDINAWSCIALREFSVAALPWPGISEVAKDIRSRPVQKIVVTLILHL